MCIYWKHLYSVRNKQETIYCYDERETGSRKKLGSKPEITRFKGLGEISPDEFVNSSVRYAQTTGNGNA